MKLSSFKGYDIRGLYPDEVDEELAYSVGRAIVRFYSAKTIVVGRDVRNSSPSLSEKMIEGIICEGADVVDIGVCTTPMVSFAVCNYGYDVGVMISASHNPPQYNAFKIMRPGINQVDGNSGLLEIKKIVEQGFDHCPGKGAVTKKDILSEYLARVLKAAEEISDLKVVVDYGNGVGSISAIPAYARLDIDVVNMYEQPDGEFPNHPANPHDVENLTYLQKRVKKEKADLGIFYDGDADRAWFVDEKGQVVPIDLLTVLLAEKELAEGKEGRVYYDLRFSKAVPDLLKKHGGEPVMLAVGNPLYKKALAEEGGIMGAEFSGHIMYKEYFGIDDGLYATLKVMSLLAAAGKSLSKMIRGVKVYESSDEVSLEAKNPDTVFERLRKEFPGKEIDLDGIYLDLPDGFISVRQSRNELELFRIRVEAKSKEELDRRFNKVIEIVTT